MEFLPSFIAAIAAIFLLLSLSYNLLLPRYVTRNHGRDKLVPLVPGSWPIIGHLQLLAGSRIAHRVLGLIADKQGPIFRIKLGIHQAVVVSDSVLAKECFTVNDRVFASRPKSMAVELMGYNYALFGFAPYGPYWRETRKRAVLELLSSSRLQALAHVRTTEIKLFINELYETWEGKRGSSDVVKVNMTEMFGSLSFNIIVSMICGKRFYPRNEEGERFKKAVKSFVNLLGVFVVSDAVPWLRWLDLGGYEKVMMAVAKELDDILQGWLEEHKRNMNSRQLSKGKEQVFMDSLQSRIRAESGEDVYGFDTDTAVKGSCLAILSGAMDTTTVTLTWAVSLLLNNPLVLEKARKELEMNVGQERQVEESDTKKLVYIDAIIKETMRLYPAAALSLPHESMEDCVLGGYKVAKGTRLLVNVWKIQHDPAIWDDPYGFRPERFLTSHKEIDVRGQHYELMPFGSGRRICVGMSLGLQVMQLTLASLIHGFEFTKLSSQPIDMDESPGLTNHKATPLEVLLSPRLSATLY